MKTIYFVVAAINNGFGSDLEQLPEGYGSRAAAKRIAKAIRLEGRTAWVVAMKGDVQVATYRD